MNALLRPLGVVALPAALALTFCTPTTRDLGSGSGSGGGGASSASTSSHASSASHTSSASHASSASSGAGASSSSTGTGGALGCGGGQTACASGCSDLTTDTDCGACGHACGTGSSCTSGYCTPVAVCSGVGNSGYLTSLGTAAYVTAGQTLFTCDLTQTNAAATSFYSTKLNGFSFTGAAASGQYAYFSSHVVTFNSNSLWQTAGTASSFQDIYDPSNGSAMTIVDRTKGFVYIGYPTAVERLELLQAGDAGIPVYGCAMGIGSLVSAAAGGGKLLYADGSTNDIRWESAGKTNCSTETTLASGLTGPGALATDGTIAAFADANGVYACNVALGCVPQAPPTPLAANQGMVAQIVLDTATPPNLYWVGASGLVECSSDPTVCQNKPTVILPNVTPAGTGGILVDATYVYYVEGSVLNRVAK